jgi:hypothetical protein
VLYDQSSRRCSIHRDLGYAALPSACQHFPRRCLIERHATFVSLSHYCPTVARMVFDEPASRGVIEAPRSLVGHLQLEGLDATDALPPLLRRGLLMDLGAYRTWERGAVELLEQSETPEAALARIRAVTNDVAGWRPGHGELQGTVERAVAAGRSCPARSRTPSFDERVAARETVRMAIPVQHRPSALVEGLDLDDARLVAPAWDEFSRPLCHFLAAHAFGNWCAYFGTGLHTIVRLLEDSLDVVRVEASRQCRAHGRALDRELLIEALRAADLLLVHLADPGALAASLDRDEGR